MELFRSLSAPFYREKRLITGLQTIDIKSKQCFLYFDDRLNTSSLLSF